MPRYIAEEPKMENPHKATMEKWANDLQLRFKTEIAEREIDINISGDARILGITYKNIYIRIVSGETKNKERPFSFYRYVSEITSENPKTAFFSRKKHPHTPMDAGEVESELMKIRVHDVHPYDKAL